MAKVTHSRLIEKDAILRMADDFKKVVKATELATAAIREFKTVFSQTKSIGSSKDVDKLSTATHGLAEEKKKLFDLQKQLEAFRTKALKGLTEEQKATKKLQKAQSENIKVRRKGNESLTTQRVRTQELNKANRLLARETLELIKPHERLTKATDKAQKEFKDLAVQYGVTSREAKKAGDRFRTLDARLRKVNNAARDGRRDVGRYGLAFGKLRSILSQGLGVLGITAGIFGLVRVMGSVIGIFSDFEKANSKLKAILGVTDNQMIALKESAKDLGATTAFTASEVTGLQTEFAKLGFPIADINNMTASTLNAAAAMGSDLAAQAKLTGATLKAFGLDSSEAARVNDVLAQATTKSALDFEKLNNSMSTIAPVANAFGFSLEGTVALLGNLSDAGFDASSAATATRNILLKLADANSELAKRLKEPVKDLPSLVRGLKQLTNEGVDLGKALELTDKRSVAAFATFLAGTDDVLALNEALELAGGTAERMAEEQLDNLAGSITILNSAWEGFILSLEDGEGGFAGVLQTIVQVTTELLAMATGTAKATDELTEAQLRIRKIANSIVTLAKVLKVLVIGFLAYKVITISMNVLLKVHTAITNALRIAKVKLAGGLKGATTAMKGFNTATKANIIAALIALVLAAVEVFKLFKAAAEEAAEAQRKLNEEMAGRKAAAKELDKRIAILDSLNKVEAQRLLSDLNAHEQRLKLDKEVTDNLLKRVVAEKLLQRARDGELSRFEKVNIARETGFFNLEKGNQFIKEELKLLAKYSDNAFTKFQEINIRNSEKEIAVAKEKLAQFEKIRNHIQDRIDFLDEENKAAKKSKKVESDLIKIQLERLKVAKETVASTEAQVAARNILIKSIELEIKRLRELGIAQSDADKGIDEDVIRQIDIEFEKRRLLSIEIERGNNNARKTENETVAQRNERFDKELELTNKEINLKKRSVRDQAFFEIATKEHTADEIILIEERRDNELRKLELERFDRTKSIEDQRVALAKEAADKIREANRMLLQDVEQELLAQIDRKNEARNQELSDDVTRQEDAVRLQRERAANGLENTLADEEARLEKARLKRVRELEEQRKKEELLALSIAFLNQFQSLSNIDPTTALAKAFRNTFLAKAIATTLSGGFKEGGYTGDDAVDKVAGVVHGKEFVIDAKTTKEQGLQGKDMDYYRNMMSTSKDKDLVQSVEDYQNGNKWSFMQHVSNTQSMDTGPLQKIMSRGHDNIVEAIQKNVSSTELGVAGMMHMWVEIKKDCKTEIIHYIDTEYNLYRRRG